MSIANYNATPHKGFLESILYALKNAKDGALSHFEGLPADGRAAYEVMMSIQKLQNFKGPHRFRTITHSFGEEDMKVLSRKEMMDLSVKLARKSFPGYQFIVAEHLDTKYFHTHIVFNVCHPTRKRNIIQNKIDQPRIRAINDKIMKEKGLSPPTKILKSREKEDYSLANKRIKMGNIPYVRDLKQKMDYARSLATDFHEYSAYLDTFKIGIRVEKKNISYLYPGKQKPIRAKHLGDEFEKKDLARQFNANHKKFSKDPILKQISGEKFKDSFGIEKAYERRLHQLENFVSKNRRQEKYMSPSTKELLALGVSKKDIEMANKGNLISYIKSNRIKTHENSKGEIILSERQHIKIRDSVWINTKNKTQGNLIDFVAIHKNISYLNALSKVTGNRRFSLLSRDLKSSKLIYKSFHVPKNKRMTKKKAAREINDLFFKLGIKSRYAESLISKNQISVSKSGAIHIFGIQDSSGAFIFEKDEQNNWNRKSVGKSNKPFFKSSKNGKEGIVFLDPFSFMQSSDKGLSFFEKKSSSILVLMENKEEEIDKFVTENSKLTKLSFFKPKGKYLDPTSMKFINKLKDKYQKFGINISITNETGKQISRSRDFDR